VKIKVKYSSIDRYSESRTFATLDGARRYARKWLGDNFDVGGWYAVSWDGVGKVQVSGDATLRDLFPDVYGDGGHE